MNSHRLADRFRGFYPVVIDIESAGFNPRQHALLEIAAITVKMDEQGNLVPDRTCHFHVKPFAGAELDPDSLAFTGINPDDPLRCAVHEKTAIDALFNLVRHGVKAHDCKRAVVVAHNAKFDHSFLKAAAERINHKRNPFHPFATFDTTTLSALAYGQTVLARACAYAGIEFDHKQAHSALYDTQKTAKLFCQIVNRWKDLGGWPLAEESLIEE